VYIGLVHDVFGYWTLPKGHVEVGEAAEAGVIRSLKKEIGIKGEVATSLGENEYIANKPDQGKIVKHVMYYLVKTGYLPLVLEKKGGLDDAKWFPYNDIATLRMYDDIKPLFEKTKVILQEQKILP
jgi:ADP-ribose pyrophosphatase YjhB (NUDIX family)